MLCERQRTSRQAGSCTEALGTWLFNFNMQQGQAERIWEWLNCLPQRKSGIGKGKGAAIAKCSEVLGRRGHIDYIFNISLIFCSEYSAIWVESTQKGLKSSSWKQERPGSRFLIPITATWIQEGCGSLSVRDSLSAVMQQRTDFSPLVSCFWGEKLSGAWFWPLGGMEIQNKLIESSTAALI